MKIVYDGSVSSETIDTMKSKHGMEFVNVEEHKRQKVEKAIKKVSKPIAVFVNSNHETLSSNKFTRNALMLAVKERGIKNYRILNKAELTEILGSAHQERIDQIIKGAKKRWMSGWGTRAVATAAMILMATNLAFADLPTRGEASFYTVKSCLKESGQCTMANGKELRDENYTCAIWDYKFGTILKVTNLKTGASVQVMVTDRGPAKRLVKQGRIIDLSRAAFKKIANLDDGIAQVEIEVLQ